MQRAVTAIYRSPEVADLVQRELEQLGIASRDITVLSGTAGADGAMDRLQDLGLPDGDARTYQQALRNGDYVVSVDVHDDSHLSGAQEIIRRPEDAYDLDELDTRYASADYVPRQQPAYAETGSLDQVSGELDEDSTVKVVEEQLNVGKQEVDQGAVRVRSFVREVPVEAEVELRSTRVYVERRPVDRPVNPGEPGLPEQVIEAHEHAERPVVAKEARVVEEIGLRQETEVQHQRIQETVRKTEVEIEDERTGLNGGTRSTNASGTF